MRRGAALDILDRLADHERRIEHLETSAAVNMTGEDSYGEPMQDRIEYLLGHPESDVLVDAETRDEAFLQRDADGRWLFHRMDFEEVSDGWLYRPLRLTDEERHCCEAVPRDQRTLGLLTIIERLSGEKISACYHPEGIRTRNREARCSGRV